MRLIFIISVLGLGFTSCKKATLDSLAFPSVSLDSYEHIDYDDHELEIPDNYLNAPIQQTLIPLTSVDEITGETYTIYGLYMGDTANIATDTVIYFCHGQARHNDYYWTREALIAQLGGLHNFGVFMIDYRGYGMSEGSATEQGLYEDADAGIDWLISKGLTGERTVYYGFSLGAIPLIHRAANRLDFQPISLICEAPLASTENLAQSSVLLNIDADFVTELELNNAEQIKNVNVPFMWLHGQEDDYVEINNGELIYANYQGPYKEAHRVENGGHANLPVIMGYDSFMSTFLTFIRK
ncbi:MAG: pimeloyl-ACP methyl ester carboxylesterase [Arenicella sp.]|jgi:pimeloyl-ACP methyl ester carboxylesterase